MDDDAKFVENLEKNYFLCDAADNMKFWIREAADNGFLPDGVDINELQEKIILFEEVKQYLDTQKALMKNPYYMYFAKDDISYTDDELKTFIGKTKDSILKDYLTKVKTLRSLKFVRSKGVDSVSAHVKKQAKRMTEILTTKAEKKNLVASLSEKAMHFGEDPRFKDPNYDDRYTPELFRETWNRFKKLDFSQLHFKNVKDIVRYRDENQFIFDQVHDMEHLLMVAINRDNAPSDSDLISLRAKIDTFIQAEMVASKIQEKIFLKGDDFIDNMSYQDLEDDVYKGYKVDAERNNRLAPPMLGKNLEKHYKAMKTKYKEDHDNRRNTIKLMYGLSHPVNGNDEEGNPGLVPGVISEKELEKRMADYQKNAYRVGYMANLYHYTMEILGPKKDAMAFAYMKKKGIDSINAVNFERTLLPYCAGKSSEEYLKVLDILASNDKAEREKLQKKLYEECAGINYCDYETKDPKMFYRNLAYRYRIENMVANLNEANSSMKDEHLKNNITAFYNTSCLTDYLCGYSQGGFRPEGAAVWYEDYFNNNGNNIEIFNHDLSDQIYSTNYVKVGEERIDIGFEDLTEIQKSVDKIRNMEQAGYKGNNQARYAGGFRDNAYATLYDEKKRLGEWHMTTDEELTAVNNYYNEYTNKYKETHDSLVEEVEKELHKKDKNLKLDKGQRYWLVLDMLTLSRSTYGKKKAGNQEEEKKQEEQKEQFTQEEIQKSASLLNGIILKRGKHPDKASKQEHVKGVEEMFRVIMSFDLNRLNFKSIADLIKNTKDDPKRFEECHAITRLAMEATNFVKGYKKLIDDKEAECVLSHELVDEVKVRCSMLMAAAIYFDEKFYNITGSPLLKASGYSIDDLLHMTPEEINQKMKIIKLQVFQSSCKN